MHATTGSFVRTQQQLPGKHSSLSLRKSSIQQQVLPSWLVIGNLGKMSVCLSLLACQLCASREAQVLHLRCRHEYSGFKALCGTTDHIQHQPSVL